MQEIYLVQTKPNDKVPDNWTKSGGTKVFTSFVYMPSSDVNAALGCKPLGRSRPFRHYSIPQGSS